MFKFFYNRKVEITIIVVFLSLIFASMLMQLPNGNEGSENSGKTQSKTEGETYSVIGNLTFDKNACTVDDFGNFSVDYSKISNSAINDVPEGVSEKDWKELLSSITYSAGLTDGDIKDGVKIPVIASLGKGQEEAFCKKYKCHIAQLDDKYTAKVNGFDSFIIAAQAPSKLLFGW